MTEIVYFAKLSYGVPVLTKIFVEKETPKTYAIARKEAILGPTYHLSSRVQKSNTIFLSQKEALEYLVGALEKHIDQLERKLVDTRSRKQTCLQMLENESQDA